MRLVQGLVGLAGAAALAGCAALAGVEQTGPNAYRIAYESYAPDSRAQDRAEEDARAKAQAFCANQGRRATQTVTRTSGTVVRADDASISHADISLRFKCR